MPLTSLPSWPALNAHYAVIRDQQMRDWFAPAHDNYPTRAERFTIAGGGITLDFSKNRVTDQTIQLLIQLAQEANVEKQREAMFVGEIINPTEKRAALHTALRAANVDVDVDVDLNGRTQGVADDVRSEYAKMVAFTEKVRTGQWVGYTGQPIRHIVQVGIGGSDLGARLVCDALHHLGDPQLQLSMHFLSNIDGIDLQRVLDQIDVETTLVIIVSKTFTTSETMTNAYSLRCWFLQSGVPESALAAHFVGVSANTDAARQFGIASENLFKFWDWVGGRFSLWSAAGLSIMLFLGAAHFEQLLAGARRMDQHFRTAPLACNLPVILALLGIWYRNCFGLPSHLIIPYSTALRYLPAYLQQLEMESNGKSTLLNGQFVDYPTAAVLWGEPGTNGQHAFFQMLHQGTTVVPIDFIAILSPAYSHSFSDHHLKLLANCFAQSEALMLGRSDKEAMQEAARIAGAQPELVPHLICAGNRPSNTLLLDALTPQTLGALLALYEHKVFVQATIWDINPFDQWGVELGKRLSKVIEHDLTIDVEGKYKHPHDSSTRALIEKAKASKSEGKGEVDV